MEGEEKDLKDDKLKYCSVINRKKQHLKIFYVNINGLTDKKIHQSDLTEDLKYADIMCFTETHLKDNADLPKINNYNAFHTSVDRNKFIGRNIKGVSIYHKENILDTIIQEMLKEGGNLIIIKIKNTKWTDIDELFFFFTSVRERVGRRAANG